jgi:hypothetical protein
MSSVAVSPTPGFLNRSWPIQLIFLAFFVLTVPLCGLVYFYRDAPPQDALWFLVLVAIYILLLATTHFVHRAFEIATLFPFFNVCFRAGTRLLDFNHFGRQNYGVLQMLKGSISSSSPSLLVQRPLASLTSGVLRPLSVRKDRDFFEAWLQDFLLAPKEAK